MFIVTVLKRFKDIATLTLVIIFLAVIAMISLCVIVALLHQSVTSLRAPSCGNVNGGLREGLD